MRQILKTIILFFFLLVEGKSLTIHDMLGREVVFSHTAQKAFSASPPMMVLLYTLAPNKMLGVNYSFLAVEKEFMLPSVQKLPVLGGFFGGGNHANIENILALKPDVVFVWDLTQVSAKHFENIFQSSGIPLVYIRQDNLYDTIEAIELMSRILGVQKRGEALIEYARKSLKRVENSVKALKDTSRKRVYFAQGEDGLYTECSNGAQSQIITLAGGINVHQCPNNEPNNYKREKISIETLYMYDPDVIIVREKSFFDSLATNQRWHNLRAYKQKQIYLMPSSPFAWLSRPPSLMRFLGLPWLHHLLYPKHFAFDTYKQTAYFYKKFLHVTLTKQDINQLLKGGIK
jgi:iron complex transport system substrate-binding protein